MRAPFVLPSHARIKTKAIPHPYVWKTLSQIHVLLPFSPQQKMNLFLFQLLPLVAFLAHTARSSALPGHRVGPPNPEGRPCYSKFRGTATWTQGTCIEPNDSYQCDDGITANTEDCGLWGNDRRISCCLHQSCNSRSSGTCQNNFKNCDGEWTVS